MIYKHIIGKKRIQIIESENETQSTKPITDETRNTISANHNVTDVVASARSSPILEGQVGEIACSIERESNEIEMTDIQAIVDALNQNAIRQMLETDQASCDSTCSDQNAANTEPIPAICDTEATLVGKEKLDANLTNDTQTNDDRNALAAESNMFENASYHSINKSEPTTHESDLQAITSLDSIDIGQQLERNMIDTELTVTMQEDDDQSIEPIVSDQQATHELNQTRTPITTDQQSYSHFSAYTPINPMERPKSLFEDNSVLNWTTPIIKLFNKLLPSPSK